ncbi:Uncharacterised protein [Myroides odoratus]|nr:hypothetical protein Myrod_0431 [Myroides odoratus DSM 2801]EKB08562.1 hypothetical protein HMPREF9716_00913 [Myroides odoratus CIP 103059]STZ32307.1 Uncharacterised protein [Myroides odoratus]
MVEVFQNIKYSHSLQKSNSGVVKVVVGFWAVVYYKRDEFALTTKYHSEERRVASYKSTICKAKVE